MRMATDVRDGFDLARHQLSLRTLGDVGWVRTANLVLSGLMVLAAATGCAGAMRGTRAAGWSAALLGAFGVCLIASGIFPPDPMAGLPEAASAPAVTTSGILYLAFGAVGFLCLAAAAFVVAGSFDRRQAHAFARTAPIGGAVVSGPAWLAAASVQLYRTVPHPDADRRNPMAGVGLIATQRRMS